MFANTSSAARRPNLLDRVRHAARVRHLSYRTEQAYVGWVKRFVLFHEKRHPHHMGKTEVEAFLTHLAVVLNRRLKTRLPQVDLAIKMLSPNMLRSNAM